MFFVKLLHIKGVRNGSFSPQRMVVLQGKLWKKLRTRVRDMYLYDVLRAAGTPDAAQL